MGGKCGKASGSLVSKGAILLGQDGRMNALGGKKLQNRPRWTSKQCGESKKIQEGLTHLPTNKVWQWDL